MDGTLLHWDETVSAATVAELRALACRRRPVRAGHRPPAAVDARHPRGHRLRHGGLLQRRRPARPRALRGARRGPAAARRAGGRHRRAAPSAARHLVRRRVRHGVPSRADLPAAVGRRRAGVAAATLDEMVQAPVAKLLARHEHLARDAFVALVEDVVGDRATVTNSSSDALAEISAAGRHQGQRAGEDRRAARRRPGGRRRLRRHAQRHRRVRVGPRRPAAARSPWRTRTPTCSPSPPTSPAPTTTTGSPPSSPPSDAARNESGRKLVPPRAGTADSPREEAPSLEEATRRWTTRRSTSPTRSPGGVPGHTGRAAAPRGDRGAGASARDWSARSSSPV